MGLIGHILIYLLKCRAIGIYMSSANCLCLCCFMFKEEQVVCPSYVGSSTSGYQISPLVIADKHKKEGLRLPFLCTRCAMQAKSKLHINNDVVAMLSAKR